MAMSDRVGEALLRTVGEAGVDVDYRATKSAYRDAADRLIDRYAADAAFDGLAYDPAAERDRGDQYVQRPAAGDGRPPPGVDRPRRLAGRGRAGGGSQSGLSDRHCHDALTGPR
jgi:glucosyl-3-phosphoglycerate synthase